ncbi:MAG: hypothetical protein QGD96_10130 [Anaerolineae bacterium]|nr:hypothetical protein [Anaerolineae bacterium]
MIFAILGLVAALAETTAIAHESDPGSRKIDSWSIVLPDVPESREDGGITLAYGQVGIKAVIQQTVENEGLRGVIQEFAKVTRATIIQEEQSNQVMLLIRIVIKILLPYPLKGKFLRCILLDVLLGRYLLRLDCLTAPGMHSWSCQSNWKPCQKSSFE